VIAGDTVYLGLHRGFGDSFAAQLASAIESVSETLSRCELPLARLVSIRVWLRDIKDLPAMEKAFPAYFAPDHYPARMTAVTEFHDADCLVMLEGIAYRGG